MAEKQKNLSYAPPEWGSPPKHNFKIVVYEKGLDVESHSLKEKQFFLIGRDATADIPLVHSSASRFHCVVQFNENGGVYLFDLGATNRTFLNRKAIKPHQFAKLNVGDFFKIGTCGRFYFLEGPESLMPPETDESLDYAAEKPGRDTESPPETTPNLSKKEVLKQYGPAEANTVSGESEKPEKAGDFCDWGQSERNYEEPSDEEAAENKKTELARKKVLRVYEDDDNDSYYDRTKKRSAFKSSRKEKQTRGLDKAEKADLLESLSVKRTNLKIQISQIESEENRVSEDRENDSLDTFMTDIENEAKRRRIAKVQTELNKIEEEIEKLKA